MTDKKSPRQETLALSTKLEEDFVSPLTAVRGALEILRDYPDLPQEERVRFAEAALRGCSRLEASVRNLGDTVYADREAAEANKPTPSEHTKRLHMDASAQVFEIDLSGLEFSSPALVNEFFDVADEVIIATGKDWFFVINYACRIWPEAWVAFAHRTKKINVNFSLGSVRYVDAAKDDPWAKAAAHDPSILASRDEALALVARARSGQGQ